MGVEISVSTYELVERTRRVPGSGRELKWVPLFPCCRQVFGTVGEEHGTGKRDIFEDGCPAKRKAVLSPEVYCLYVLLFSYCT